MEVKPQLRFTAGSDYLTCQIDLKLLNKENEVLLSSGLLFGVQLKDWEGTVNEKGDKLPSLDEIKDVISVIWELTTGAIAALAFEKGKISVIVPPVNLDELISSGFK